MALVYAFVWRVLHVLLHVHRTLVTWLRIRLRSWNSRLWSRALAALLLPIAVSFPNQKRFVPATGKRVGRPCRWGVDVKSFEKLPLHIGLLIAEEEPRYTDIANLVVWCMAVGISYVSVYDNQGVFRRNSSRLMGEILRQQQELLGPEGSKQHTVDFLNNDPGVPGHQVSWCQSVVNVVSPDDGKLKIVQAARQLCRAVEQKEKTSTDIDVAVLDSLLRESKSPPDPELVLKFGPLESSVGFLPWHIRLTEFISLPSHVDICYEDLHSALQRYASYLFVYSTGTTVEASSPLCVLSHHTSSPRLFLSLSAPLTAQHLARLPSEECLVGWTQARKRHVPNICRLRGDSSTPRR
ncbi:hypothetical protein DPEC_G00084710 [Dallia pectoralis]|uniref:Uncharacterized protein n=1 Tax=Dallia pectoralis TaxID=75939 RepID=A0ACC2H059_DALPE|nr:hypothetical protein DPEC_G00084710 [Dallia pectoralis]